MSARTSNPKTESFSSIVPTVYTVLLYGNSLASRLVLTKLKAVLMLLYHLQNLLSKKVVVMLVKVLVRVHSSVRVVLYLVRLFVITHMI